MNRLPLAGVLLAGMQWLFFMFANTVVIPLSIGAAFHLSPLEISSALQRSFIFTGIACIFQVLIGHRYSLMEGQSGLWWGVILSLAASASAGGMSLTTLGGGLATGIILSGAILAISGALGLGSVLKKLFTPVVMAVFLLLLSSQLILIFLKGMLGLTGTNPINLPVSLLSFFLVFFVAWLNLKGRGMVSNFSILIGITVGWVAYVLLFPQQEAIHAPYTLFVSWFPWGKPNFEIGIIMTAVLTGLINTTNTVATLRGAEQLYDQVTSDSQYKRSFMLTGLNSIVSGLLGLVPYAPYTSSLGFLQSTRILERSAFIAGGLFFMLLGLVPFLGSFFATLPISVGDAVLFVAYLQLFGAALRNLDGIHFNSKTIYRISGPTLLGISLMNLPSNVFSPIPLFIRPLVSNGLLMGILLSIVLENILDWSQFEKSPADQAEPKKAS